MRDSISQELREANLGAWILDANGGAQDLGVAALAVNLSIEDLEPLSLER